MKMNEYKICCEKCFESIGKEHTGAAWLWLDLCAIKNEDDNLIILEAQDFPGLGTLEKSGYLISTESDSLLYIKLKGCMKTEDGELFVCVKEGYHD